MLSKLQIQLPAYKSLNLFLKSSLGLICLSAFCFLFVAVFQIPHALKRSDYIAPPNLITHLSVGTRIQMSDSFWLRAMQDFEYCDSPNNEKECSGKSWLYKIINAVTELDPNFFEAHYYGALALSVIISDYEGASAIFDKAVIQFPKNWMLLYNAGYHALVEEKNKLKASKLYFEAGKLGAPSWVAMMAGKLAADSGDIDYSAQILEGMISMNQQPEYVERLKKKLEEKKKEIK